MNKDPFKADPVQTAPETNGLEPDWRRIPPHELQLIVAIGERCALLIAESLKDKPQGRFRVPNKTWAAAEIACAHLSHPLDLSAMAVGDNLALLSDYVRIASNIDRATCRVFGADQLHFAKKDGSIAARIRRIFN